jgi:threonine/homoserine/homoserine lactone efflux protein
MKLSLKQKALTQTLGMFVLAIVAGAIVSFILMTVSTKLLINLVGGACLVWFAYLFYSITLSRLEHQETLKELNKKD